MTAATLRVAVVSADGTGLDGLVGQHFGRCAAYTVVDLDDTDVVSTNVVENPFAQGHQPGEVPAFIASLGAEVLLAGGIGQRAIQFFDQYDVRVSSGHSGTVREAVTHWIAGRAEGAEPCKSGGHCGTHE